MRSFIQLSPDSKRLAIAAALMAAVAQVLTFSTLIDQVGRATIA